MDQTFDTAPTPLAGVATSGCSRYPENRCWGGVGHCAAATRLMLLLLALCLAPISTPAQEMLEAVVQREMQQVLGFLYGKQPAFTATAVVVFKSNQQEESLTATLLVADGRLRAETGLDRCKFGPAQGDELAFFRQLGIDQAVAVLHPGPPGNYLIFPRKKAVCAIPAENGKLKIERKETGREDLDGQPCVRAELTITDANGDKVEGVTWESVKQHGLPIQVEIKDDDTALHLRLRDVQATKPDPWLFEIPAGYKRYPGLEPFLQELFQNAMPFLDH